MYGINTSDSCPHCGNNLYLTTPAHYYGSPFRICPKCKQEYVDYRYHEIAVEGVQEKDTRLPTEEERKDEKKGNYKSIFVGLLIILAAIVLFIIGLATGWLLIGAIPLLIFGVVSFFSGLTSLFKKQTSQDLQKKLQQLELERQQSIARINDPHYAAKLQSIGYRIETPNQQSKMISCSVCGTTIDENDKFCPKCGKEQRRQDL